jgi:hypothetical protein
MSSWPPDRYQLLPALCPAAQIRSITTCMRGFLAEAGVDSSNPEQASSAFRPQEWLLRAANSSSLPDARTFADFFRGNFFFAQNSYSKAFTGSEKSNEFRIIQPNEFRTMPVASLG